MERRCSMYGVGNPYGAVPNALKEVRLSMSDVLNNIIQSKELDRRVAQDAAQAELQKANIEAGLQKFGIEMGAKEKGLELENVWKGRQFGIEEEKLAETTRQHNVTAGLEKEKLEEQKKVNAAHINQMNAMASKLGIDMQISQENLKQVKEDNKEDTIENHIKKSGLPSWFVGYMGVDGKTMMKGSKFSSTIKDVGKAIFTDPYSYAMANQHKLSDDALGIYNKIATIPEGDPARAPLIQEYNSKIAAIDKSGEFMQTLKMSPDKIVEQAIKTYASNPALQMQYPNVQDYVDEYTKLITVFRGAHNKFRQEYGKIREKTKTERDKEKTGKGVNVGTSTDTTINAMGVDVPIETAISKPTNIPSGWKATNDPNVFIDDKGKKKRWIP